MARLAVFGYGSLVDRASAGRTLGREVDRVWPARLEGFVRRFSQARDNRACEKTFARADSGEIPDVILGLNLEPRDGARASPPFAAESFASAPNGALIELTEAELERLDLREIRYLRVEVGDRVRAEAGAPAFDSIVTYTAKPANLAPRPPAGAVILRSYAEATERAFEALGAGQLDEYRRTTPYPVEIVDGRLVKDEIPEGNPREW